MVEVIGIALQGGDDLQCAFALHALSSHHVRTFHQVEKARVEVLAGFARQLALGHDGADLLTDLAGEYVVLRHGNCVLHDALPSLSHRVAHVAHRQPQRLVDLPLLTLVQQQ
jgi:hypothetical protein